MNEYITRVLAAADRMEATVSEQAKEPEQDEMDAILAVISGFMQWKIAYPNASEQEKTAKQAEVVERLKAVAPQNPDVQALLMAVCNPEGTDPEELVKAVERLAGQTQPEDDGADSGVALRDFSDPLQGKIKLVELPNFDLYDTQFQMNPYQWPKGKCAELLANPAPVTFFQNPAGRGAAFTNVETSGQLPWPKRMRVNGMSIQLDRPLDPKVIAAMSLELRVGDKRERVRPLVHMDVQVHPDGLRRTYSLHWPAPGVYIPSVQFFAIVLDTGGHWIGETELRATVHGTLYCEVQ